MMTAVMSLAGLAPQTEAASGFVNNEPMTSSQWASHVAQANSNCLNGPCYPGNEYCGQPFENAPKFHLMDQHG